MKNVLLRKPVRRPLAGRAFTLVEVTLALGIVSFAVLSILGSMSVGMNTIRDAKTDVTRAQIVAQMGGNLAQTPFDQLEQFASAGPYYFDQAARQLNGAGPTALYTATLQVSSPDNTAYPGAPATGLSNSAKLVAVIVSSVRPGTAQAISSSTTSLVVPKS